jgi:hypothetical protein
MQEQKERKVKPIKKSQEAFSKVRDGFSSHIF